MAGDFHIAHGMVKCPLGQIGSENYFRVADHPGVIACWLESKCQVCQFYGQRVTWPGGRPHLT